MEERGRSIEELTREDALRAHQVNYSYIEKGNDAVISAGNSAIRSLFLMNGGALVAMLTFTSNWVAKANPSIPAEMMLSPMLWFAIGLAVATGASGGTYLTNFCYVAMAQNQVLKWAHPYVEDSAISRRWGRVGTFFHVLTIAASMVSLGLFVWGLISVKEVLINHVP